MPQNINSDKVLFFNENMLIFFLFLHKNLCSGYSLEVSLPGTSNEYQQHVLVEKEEYMGKTASIKVQSACFRGTEIHSERTSPSKFVYLHFEKDLHLHFNP